MFNINELQNVIVEFKIPFALDLMDCTKKEHKGKPFLLVIDNIPARISLERIYNESPTIDGVNVAPFSKIEKDRYGLFSKMKVQVWFDNQTFNSDKINKNLIQLSPKQFFSLAIKYLNKFIFDYKRVTRQYWINQIYEENIIGYSYFLLDKNGEVSSIQMPITQTVNFNGGKEFSLSSLQEENFRNLLRVTYNDLQDDLFLSIYDNFDKTFYNIALIQCAIFFENYVYSNLKQKMSNRKLNKIKKKETCGCLAGIYEVCSRGLNEMFSLDFGSTNEFNNFHQYVLKIRNNLVHGERLDQITKEECDQAIQSTLNAIGYLREEFKRIS